MNFGQALELLKLGKTCSRLAWSYDFGKGEMYPSVKLQRPDEHSKMTKPYLYMEKLEHGIHLVRFPLDLSCESVLADDWIEVIENKNQIEMKLNGDVCKFHPDEDVSGNKYCSKCCDND